MIVEFTPQHFFTQPLSFFHGKIPFIVSDLINELKKRDCQNVQGLFRLNGSDAVTKELCDELDRGKIMDWSKYSEIHAVSTALKRYFRGIKDFDPILPPQTLDLLVKTLDLKEKEEFVPKIKEIVLTIEDSKKNLLAYLMQFVKTISLNAEHNLMSPTNLAICIGPNLLSEDESSTSRNMTLGMLLNSIIEKMIMYSDELFDFFVETGDSFCSDGDIVALSTPPLSQAKIENLISRNHERSRFKIIDVLPSFKLPNSNVRITKPTRQPPPALFPEEEFETKTELVSQSDLSSESVSQSNSELLSRSSSNVSRTSLPNLNPPKANPVNDEKLKRSSVQIKSKRDNEENNSQLSDEDQKDQEASKTSDEDQKDQDSPEHSFDRQNDSSDGESDSDVE